MRPGTAFLRRMRDILPLLVVACVLFSSACVALAQPNVSGGKEPVVSEAHRNMAWDDPTPDKGPSGYYSHGHGHPHKHPHKAGTHHHHAHPHPHEYETDSSGKETHHHPRQ